MGRTVARLAAADASFQIIAGLDRSAAGQAPPEVPSLIDPAGAAAQLEAADVVIDFSAPEFLQELLDAVAPIADPPAVVVGTTGLGPEEQEKLQAASARGAVLTAANFSVGVNLLLVLAERATTALGAEFDVEIVETHHRRKEDAPSGTALALGEAVAAARGVELDAVRRDGRSGRPGARRAEEIGFHALRGGDVVGDHHVHFIGDLERVELVHRASDRALFAAGALRAARWIAGREPGRYSMRDVLGL